MKETIKEVIDKFLINSLYDPKMTLTENEKVFIFEAPGVGAQSQILVKSALGDLGQVKNMFKLAMTESRLLKLIQMDADSFLKEMKKEIRADLRSGVEVGTIGPRAKEMSKLDAIRDITNKVKLENRVLTTAEIEAIKAQSKLYTNKLIQETAAVTAKNLARKAAKLAKEAGNEVAAEVKNLGGATSFLTKFKNITTWRGFKDSLKKWGLVTVLSAAALYALWDYFYGDKPVPEEAEKIEGVPPPKDGGNKKTSCPAVTNTGVVYEYEYPGDTKYVYGIKDAKYYAKNRKTGIEFKIHDCYPETVKKLNASKVKINSNTETENSGEPNVVVTDNNTNTPSIPEVGTDAESLDNISNDTNALN